MSLLKIRAKECLKVEAFSLRSEMEHGYSLTQQKFNVIECTWTIRKIS